MFLIFLILSFNENSVLVLEEDLADALWKRLKRCFIDEDLLLIKPMGFGNEGEYFININ